MALSTNRLRPNSIAARFWGWRENEREVKKDFEELSQRAREGKPLYGTSHQPEWVQQAAAANSTFSQLKFCTHLMFSSAGLLTHLIDVCASSRCPYVSSSMPLHVSLCSQVLQVQPRKPQPPRHRSRQVWPAEGRIRIIEKLYLRFQYTPEATTRLQPRSPAVSVCFPFLILVSTRSCAYQRPHSLNHLGVEFRPRKLWAVCRSFQLPRAYGQETLTKAVEGKEEGSRAS